MRRRSLLAGASLLPLVGCSDDGAPHYDGSWIGAAFQRGHRLRDMARGGPLPTPAVQRRAAVIVIGAGIAGLGCARALQRRGIDDVHLFELEDQPGGNSRGHAIAGMRCPLGAHYVPVPGEPAVEVAALFEELGLSRNEHGRVVYDEMNLCHSPQERIFVDAHWHEGLLPPVEALPRGERAETLAQYRRFSKAVTDAGQRLSFAIPTARSRWSAELGALDSVSFAAWLDTQGFTAPALRWYLDYCCRDDYGAGSSQVSAWAGLHYFASRHGFRAPGDANEDRDGVLTWPEGNGWLAERMAAPFAERIHGGMIAMRVTEGRHEVDVDLFDLRHQHHQRWTAPQVVLAIPLFIAARLLAARPPALDDVAERLPHSPWLVANIHLEAPLADSPGAPPSWDNVVYGSAGLGYVDAMHQSTRAMPGATVLTSYWALGGDDAAQLATQRRRLLSQSWSGWARTVLSDLAPPHPDLLSKAKRVDLMRYGHAMSIPAPGVRSSAALQALAANPGRVSFAHGDLSGYSIFEEALYHGQRAADRIAASRRG